MIYLTGIKPTGMPHLGNYVGAIEPALKLIDPADSADPAYGPSVSSRRRGLYFIADGHALISKPEPSKLQQHILEVAATWLACGLNPHTSTLYLQTDIAEIFELQWLLSCFTSKGVMNRAHSYKARRQENAAAKQDPDQGVNMGLFSYPVLMAADILFAKADVVPVGEDQRQHVEMARDVAERVNQHCGRLLLQVPQLKISQRGFSLPGLDGRKMSKSYGNHVPLFAPEKQLRRLLMKVPTDSSAPHDPKPTEGTLWEIYKAFASVQELQAMEACYREGSAGWGEIKEEVFRLVNYRLCGARQSYQDWMGRPHKIREVLRSGAASLRPQAKELVGELKSALGFL